MRDRCSLQASPFQFPTLFDRVPWPRPQTSPPLEGIRQDFVVHQRSIRVHQTLFSK